VRVLARAALCLAVLFAGCGGATSPGGRVGTAPETVTPAPVPTDRSPTVREGVDGERLAPLAERHEARLADRSFTALGRRVITGPVGILLDARWERRVAPDRDAYHEVRTGTETWGWNGPAPADRRHTYHEPERTVIRQVTGGEVRYEVDRDPPSGGPLSDLDDADHLRSLLGAFESWRVVSHPNGTLVLSGRGLERSEVVWAPPPLADSRNATAEVRVEPGGRVVRASVRFEATVDGMPVAVVEVRRYVAVGSTSTDRPPWYDAALGGPSADVATRADVTTGG
jgi:hypothetical protein